MSAPKTNSCAGHSHIPNNLEITGFLKMDINPGNENLLTVGQFNLNVRNSKLNVDTYNFIRYFLFDNFVSDALLPLLFNQEFVDYGNTKLRFGFNGVINEGLKLDEFSRIYLTTYEGALRNGKNYSFGFDLQETKDRQKEPVEVMTGDSNEGISISLSEENANMLARIVHSKNVLEVNIKPEMLPKSLELIFNTTFFKNLISRVYNTYEKRNFYYSIKLLKPLEFDFSSGLNIKMTPQVDLVMLPEISGEVFTLELEVSGSLGYTVYKEGKLVSEISNLNLISMKGNHKGKVFTFKQVASGLRKMIELMRYTINEFLKQGIELEFDLIEFISDLLIEAKDGFAQIKIIPNI